MKRGTPTPGAEGSAGPAPLGPAFDEVVGLIRAARQRAAQAVSAELIDLYWRIGQYLHHKIEKDGWAKGTVLGLSAFIARQEPGLRGFSAQNLWRMRQFFAAYPEQAKLSALSRQLPWSSHLHILSGAKRDEEREFYLRMAVQQRWPVRELARQIDSGLFERAVLNPPKLSTALRDSLPQPQQQFRDAYMLEFLALPEPHTEAELHRSLLRNLSRFLTELGRDFCFVGSEYPVQVGGQDFVLDRDLRKPHENPAIGVLLCASKDDEVVEYALSRSASPALIAQYQTQLPDKALLQAKLHEFYLLADPSAGGGK